jgi:transcriptional regulator with XRE-family HTH domain
MSEKPTLGEIIGRQIEAARKLHTPQLSQAGLSRLLNERGVRMHQSVIARLESGERRVTVDDLLALAAALRVSPLYLLSGSFTNEVVPVTPNDPASPAKTRYWLRGELPLSADDSDTYFELVPDEERLARQWRGFENLRLILGRDLKEAVRRNDHGAMLDAVKDMRTELEWLQDEIAHEKERARRARKED